MEDASQSQVAIGAAQARTRALIRQYFTQLTVGCGNRTCTNVNCHSSPCFKHGVVNNNIAGATALELMKSRASLCPPLVLPLMASGESTSGSSFSPSREAPKEGQGTPATTPMNVPGVGPSSELLAIAPARHPLRRNIGSPEGGDAFAFPPTNALTPPANQRTPTPSANQRTPTPSANQFTPTPPLLRATGSNFYPSPLDEDIDEFNEETDEEFLNSMRENTPTRSNLVWRPNLPRNLMPHLEAMEHDSYVDLLDEPMDMMDHEPEYNRKETSEQNIETQGPSALKTIKNNLPPPKKSEYLTEERLDLVITECELAGNWSRLIHILGQVFMQADSLMLSFLKTSEDVCEKADVEASEKSGSAASSSKASFLARPTTVDLKSLRGAFQRLFSVEDKQFYGSLMNAITYLCREAKMDLKVRKLYDAKPDYLNVFVILFELPLILDPEHFESVLPAVCRAVSYLPVEGQARLCRVWSGTEARQDWLVELQKMLMQLVTIRCLTTEWDRNKGLNEDEMLSAECRVLKLVYCASLMAGEMDPTNTLRSERECNAEFDREMQNFYQRVQTLHSSGLNRSVPKRDRLLQTLRIAPNDVRKPLIPHEEFVNETLCEYLQDDVDNMCYRNEHLDAISFMEHPFLLTTEKKSAMLYFDNQMRMIDERRGAMFQALIANNPQAPYLKLRIARDRVVEDALLGLEIATMENPGDLKKQLYVEFEGEQGIDEGGLSKEFFQLIIEKIFNPDYGMFTYDEETFTFWFNPAPVEDMDREYSLIGTVLGIAIYNHIILDVRFPSVLYRKLTGKLGTFNDLKDSHPILARGLQSLLDYEGDDLEDVFSYNFRVSYRDLFGSTLNHDLKPNGESIPVTQSNKQEFVDLYADFLLNSSIRRQFRAFRRGFQMVVDESPLNNMFYPEEIELLVCGSKDYNFNELERVTEYEGEYTAESRVIRDFWSVVHAMSDKDRRRLLQFATGSDRVPVGGMRKMRFVVARQGADSDRLPTAHTCFNVLLLPEYCNRDKLERCLYKAITHFTGFGML